VSSYDISEGGARLHIGPLSELPDRFIPNP
jgi:hypothetical protein